MVLVNFFHCKKELQFKRKFKNGNIVFIKGYKYHINGKLKSITEYDKNLSKNGIEYRYSTKGALIEEVFYYKGIKVTTNN